jgi:hypothetical protein
MVGLHYHLNDRIVEEFGDYIISTPSHRDRSFPNGTPSATSGILGPSPRPLGRDRAPLIFRAAPRPL